MGDDRHGIPEQYGISDELIELVAKHRRNISDLLAWRKDNYRAFQYQDTHALRITVVSLLYEIARHRQATREREARLGQTLRTEYDIRLWSTLIEFGMPYEGDDL